MNVWTWGWAVVLLAGLPVRGDDAGIVVSHARDFKIPFVVDPARRGRVEHLTLLVSSDRGKTWQEAARATPDQSHFHFSAPNDGNSWFAVRLAQRGEKEEAKETTPEVKVRVETRERDETREREREREQARQEERERADDARIRIELLEMKVAADKKQIQRMLQIIQDTELQQILGFATGPVAGGKTEEEREANLKKLQAKLEDVRRDFEEKSKELARERRRLAELERRAGRPASAPGVEPTRRRVRAIERIIDEILKEIED